MIRMHPDSDLLVEYAAGSLSFAPCISVTTHLQYCATCCHSVESLKEIGGNMLDAGESMPVSDDLLDKILSCIEATADEDLSAKGSDINHANGSNTNHAKGSTAAPKRAVEDPIARDLPDYVRDLLPTRELNWRKLSSSLKVAPLSVGEDKYELALHRINAGGKAPSHDHTGQEITVVLKGSFSDEDGVYQPGDFIVRHPGDKHRPFAARNEECICLSVLEAPIRLTGIKRIFNPFLSFSPS